MSELDLRLERIVNATPDAAFKHWVDADARCRWYAPDDSWIVVEAKTDLRVAGRGASCSGPTPDELNLEHGMSKMSTHRTGLCTRPATSIRTGALRSRRTSP